MNILYGTSLVSFSIASFMGGGYANSIQNWCQFSGIVTGYKNHILGSPDQDPFADGDPNEPNPTGEGADHSVIVGGAYNWIIGPKTAAAIIGAGAYNEIQSDSSYSIIGAGFDNTHDFITEILFFY